jgi:parallel beta-helix repeat protein
VRGEPSEITVPDDYPTIQEAINNASDGDTIFVKGGTYYEHVVVNKSLSLIGENRDTTIIDGNRTGSVVIVTANNVSIVGFTLQNSRPGPSGDYGIFLLSDNNVISGNLITNNSNGIGIWLAKKNLISGNNIFSNEYGIELYIAVNNTFYHNNFNNYPYQAKIDGYSPTFWNDGTEGNFWANYTGKDSNGDGIGDTPYPLPPNNQDERPLMGMFSSFAVTSQGKTYKVNIISNSTISEFKFEVGLETGNKIISLNDVGVAGTIGFCRITFSTELMFYPYIILHGIDELTSKKLSNETHAILYFTYIHDNHTIMLISSKLQFLFNSLNATYSELLDNYESLNTTYYNLLGLYDNLNTAYSELLNNYKSLNTTYYDLLNDYNFLLGNYSQLQTSYNELNSSYQKHLLDYYESLLNITNLTNLYYELLNTNAILQLDLYNLNTTFYELLNDYNLLLDDYSQLKTNYGELDNSYQEHLSNYSDNVLSIQNLTYVFGATTAIFLITTVYLSMYAHKNNNKASESEN